MVSFKNHRAPKASLSPTSVVISAPRLYTISLPLYSDVVRLFARPLNFPNFISHKGDRDESHSPLIKLHAFVPLP